MKYAVTGANGMLGRHMTSLLSHRNIDYLPIGRELWDLEEWYSRESLDRLLIGVDAIFHIGAYVPDASSLSSKTGNGDLRKIFDANVRSCLNLFDWAVARDIPVVFISGAIIYKNPHGRNIVESDEKVVNGFGGFYGYSKFLAEQIANNHIEDGLKIVILRPSSIYGFGLSENKLIPIFLSRAKRNEDIQISGVGNRINMVHAYDVSLAALTAIEKSAWGEFNIASEQCISIQDMASSCISVFGSSSQIQVEEEESDSVSEFIRYDLNCSKAKSKFGYSPLVSFTDGIKLMTQQRYTLYHN